MKDERNKRYAVAMAALLTCAVGCAGPVGFNDRDGNGSLGRGEYTYPEDGFWSEGEQVGRACFRSDGSLYDDPALTPIGGRHGAIAEDYSRRINDACRKKAATLVVLIHGIDNTYPEARRSYELARMRVVQLFPARPFVFLEIYWDALCGNALAVWGEARPGSKWVGLGLRTLLAGIDHGTPVRILTHSRGATVACAALWNVPLREGPEFDGAYADRQKEIPTPVLGDLRLAMIAPAMPEEDFETCGDRTPLDRVIVGINEDDPALNKGGIGPGFGGSTRLGCRFEAFDEGVAPLLNRGRQVAYAVDLSASRVHDFKDYLLRRAVKDRLLPLLLEPAQPEAVASGR